MPDQDKVIKGLELCAERYCDSDCPYYRRAPTIGGTCAKALLADALTLLKEHEEQIKNRDKLLEEAREEIKWLQGMLKEREPKRMWLCNGELCCPQCGAICKSYYHYCDECGQAVKRE